MTVALVDVYDGTRIREGALEFLYRLMEERSTDPSLNISHRAMPTFEQHRGFWSRRPYRCAYLVSHPREEDLQTLPPISWCGYVSATHRNEIGIVLMPSHRGRRIGVHAVLQLMAKHKPNPAVAGECNGRWLANINPENDRSIGMFTQALGFKEIQRTYELPDNPDPEALNQD